MESTIKYFKPLQQQFNQQMDKLNKEAELRAKFKAIMPNASEAQLDAFVKANLPAEEVLPSNACRIDDPDCLSCGS